MTMLKKVLSLRSKICVITGKWRCFLVNSHFTKAFLMGSHVTCIILSEQSSYMGNLKVNNHLICIHCE